MTGDLAAHLRDEFDESFRLEPTSGLIEREHLLRIGIDGEEYGLRLSQVEGLFRGKRITRLPEAPPACLGIAGFRGALVTVYDLASLLGHPRGDAGWLALVSAPNSTRLALAFDSLLGQLDLESSQLVSGPAGLCADFLARLAESTLPILSVPSVVERITGRSESEP